MGYYYIISMQPAVAKYIALRREWLISLARYLWSEVVRFDSHNFLRSNFVGFDSHTPYYHPARSCFPPTSSFCSLPIQSEFPRMLWLRWSPFMKGGWWLTYANKTREAHIVSTGTSKKLPWPIKNIFVMLWPTSHGTQNNTFFYQP